MAGPDPAIHEIGVSEISVDARIESGHDGGEKNPQAPSSVPSSLGSESQRRPS
jgi:hypothetical protein